TAVTIGRGQSMDYRIFHAVNVFATHHKWLAHATYAFETVGVAFYAAAVLLLWLATAPGAERRWKFAALSGASSAGLALAINQMIARVWHRPRPYQSHQHVYHLTNSRDPSFPSDHASAAFGIAFGIYFFDRRIGRFFIVVAALIAAGRLVVGAHYLTDVLASLIVAVIAASLISKVGRPLLYRMVLLLERVSDPVARRYHDRRTRHFANPS
ncbi:MAG: phosphatase PAP2 family protein, partial [Gaiellaceae bacterium]